MKLYRWRIATKSDLDNMGEKFFRDQDGRNIPLVLADGLIKNGGVAEVLEECPKFGWGEVIQAARVYRENEWNDLDDRKNYAELLEYTKKDFLAGVEWLLDKLLHK